MPFGPCPEHGGFKKSLGLGLVARRCKGMHARVCRGKGGGVMGNMLRRVESSWIMHEV